MVVPQGIADWVRLPGPAAVLDAVQLRIRREQRTEVGPLTTLRLTAEQRREIALMLGTRWELSGKPVRLQDLAARLAEHQLTVRSLVESLCGPIEPDRARRDRAQSVVVAELERTAGSLAAVGVPSPVVEQWLADTGLPRPGEGVLAALAEQVGEVMTQLQGIEGKIRLAQLAADVLNDAHALDSDRILGRAVARLLAIVHELPRPQRAGRAWRAAWAAAGVVCDGVSSRVLVLNLPLTGDAPAALLCAAAPGEPIWLTLRSLIGNWTASAVDVFVCENPTVAEAAADALGASCPPLVCTDGIASGAALDLLAGLSGAGCVIRARADFDPSGFIIAGQVLSVAPRALSWRFDVPTYAYESGTSGDQVVTEGLEAAVAALADGYRTVNAPVHEERMLATLLDDLRHSSEVQR
ncbi:DUF2399 domain-containing protein [Amycolatopsis speibonae]|uniref:DUF2399 domain-containing protein n=1 Tax=Amycolatopsis speibonae TaxID=1450224 RepID=A0ABV7NXK3_9PSEU